MKHHCAFLVAGLLVFSITACLPFAAPAAPTAPAPPPAVVTVVNLQTPVVPTPVPPTVPPPPPPSPVPTQTAVPTVPPATAVPQPTATATTAAAGCKNIAAFVADVTIPDGAYILPFAPFTKTWRLRNTGDCVWNSQYQFTFVNGTAMTAAKAYPVSATVAAGQTVDLAVPMTAPGVLGRYTSQWQLRDPLGVPFGPVVYVSIYAGTLLPQPVPQRISLSGDWKSGPHGLHLTEAAGCSAYPCAYQVDYSYWTGGTPDTGTGQGTFNGITFSASIPGNMPGAPAKTLNCTVPSPQVMTCATSMGMLTFTR